jgi:hypothetical protein
MMWQIYGADATTGSDVMITVDEPDEKSARMAAKKRRILVTRLHQIEHVQDDKPAEVLNYESPGESKFYRSQDKRILSAANNLLVAAFILKIAGCLSALGFGAAFMLGGVPGAGPLTVPIIAIAVMGASLIWAGTCSIAYCMEIFARRAKREVEVK